LKTFADLQFRDREGGIQQAILDFENGYGVSVLRFLNQEDEYELGIRKGGKLDGTWIHDEGVFAHNTPQQISELMATIQMLEAK